MESPVTHHTHMLEEDGHRFLNHLCSSVQWNFSTILEQLCPERNFTHRRGCQEGLPAQHPQLADFEQVIRPLSGLSFPNCEVLQPLSPFSSQVQLAVPAPGWWNFYR